MLPQAAERVERLKLSLIDPDPDQPRKTFPAADLERLRDSIDQDNLQQRPAVRPHPTAKGRWMLVYGERRFRALRALGRTEELFTVLGGGLDAVKVLDAQTIENCHRQNLNYMDEAMLIARHRGLGRSFEEIARRMGESVGTLRNRLKLLDLPTEVQMMVAQGKLPQVSALNLSQYRSPTGDQIRIAYDLIAGKDSADLQSAAIARLKHPHGYASGGRGGTNNPQRIFHRILQISYRVKSEERDINSWGELTAEQRAGMFERLPAQSREGLKDALERQIRARTNLLASLNEKPEKDFRASPPPTRAANPKKSAEPETNFSAREAEMVLTALSVRDTFDLSKTRIATFCKFPEKEAERRILGALRMVQNLWRAPSNGEDSVEHSLRTRIAHLRHDTQSPRFSDFVVMLTRVNRSTDPVRVSALL